MAKGFYIPLHIISIRLQQSTFISWSFHLCSTSVYILSRFFFSLLLNLLQLHMHQLYYRFTLGVKSNVCSVLSTFLTLYSLYRALYLIITLCFVLSRHDIYNKRFKCSGSTIYNDAHIGVYKKARVKIRLTMYVTM